jgi:peptide/nickel transport system permease protein
MTRTARLITQYALVALAALVVNFVLPRLAPGDAADYLVPPSTGVLSPEERTELLATYDLDGTIAQQFGTYLGSLAQGDLGISIRDGRPVTTVIGDRIGWSLLLVGTAAVASVILGVGLGFAAGWRRGSKRDAGILATVLTVDALPAFFIGLMLILTFSVRLRWFPVYGAIGAGQGLTIAAVPDVLRRLVLPATTLTFAAVGSIFVVARAAMISELAEDYIFMGRAQGLSDKKIRRRARRNALVPVSTVSLLGFSAMVGVAIVVESVFSYPGLGTLGFDAVRARDYPVLQAVFLLFALVAIAVNLANDFLYPLLDPRVRRAGR